MAVALKVRIFKTALELATFAADAGNDVATIVNISPDELSGVWVLFYLNTP